MSTNELTATLSKVETKADQLNALVNALGACARSRRLLAAHNRLENWAHRTRRELAAAN